MSFFQTDSLPTKANFLPITEQELKWNLYVTGAGFDGMRPGRSFVNEGRPELYRLEQYKNRILPEYVFLYIADGAGQYISDQGGSLTVKKGDVFILFPGSEHQLIPDKEVGWKDVWITANGPYIHSLTQNGILDPRQPIVSSPSTAEKIAGRIERLCSQIFQRLTLTFETIKTTQQRPQKSIGLKNVSWLGVRNEVREFIQTRQRQLLIANYKLIITKYPEL